MNRAKRLSISMIDSSLCIDDIRIRISIGRMIVIIYTVVGSRSRLTQEGRHGAVLKFLVVSNDGVARFCTVLLESCS